MIGFVAGTGEEEEGGEEEGGEKEGGGGERISIRGNLMC